MSAQAIESRKAASQARRIVVKIGSRVLVQKSGRPDPRRMQALVKDLAWLTRQGREIAVVSSGAIASGVEALGLKRLPSNLPDLQMAAAVGQNRLMARYVKFFSAERCRTAQVLLTHDDLKDRARHLNARNTMMNLLRHGIIPIVNENDVVAVDEIKVGDNDVLASLVALLTQADLLVLLTTTDGLRKPTAAGRSRRIPFLEGVDDGVLSLASGKGSDFSTGGMATKLQAAQTAATVGIPSIIADGRKPQTLRRIVKGEDVGTILYTSPAQRQGVLSGRKQWIAFFQKPMGSLVIDGGAADALKQKGKSLLPIGIKAVKGNFPVGAVVNIQTETGTVVARGLAEYSSNEIDVIKGHRTSEIARLLGSKDYDEVVHRDNMVLLGGTGREPL